MGGAVTGRRAGDVAVRVVAVLGLRAPGMRGGEQVAVVVVTARCGAAVGVGDRLDTSQQVIGVPGDTTTESIGGELTGCVVREGLGAPLGGGQTTSSGVV